MNPILDNSIDPILRTKKTTITTTTTTISMGFDTIEINLVLDLETTVKLKFTAWFEVNPTFGCREIRLLKPGGPFAPTRLIRVKVMIMTA